MGRLTRKEGQHTYSFVGDKTEYLLTHKFRSEAVIDELLRQNYLLRNKLGQLEDLEEELGIDLITLVKSLKVWAKNIRIGTDIVNEKECHAVIILVVSKDLAFDIYSTTKYEEVVLLEKLETALTKEELL